VRLVGRGKKVTGGLVGRGREDIRDGWEEESQGKEEKIKGNKMRREDN
jgi:hypothetical protein